MCFISGSTCDPKLPIAIYAVKTNQTDEVVTFNDVRAEELHNIYLDINTAIFYTETITEIEERIVVQEDGSTEIFDVVKLKTYLYVDIVHNTIFEAASLYGFIPVLNILSDMIQTDV